MHLDADFRKGDTQLIARVDGHLQAIVDPLLIILLTDVVPFMSPQDHMLAISPVMELVVTRVDKKKRQKHPDRGDSRYLSLHPGYMSI